MGRVAPFSVADKAKAEMTNVVYDLDGRVFLAGKNLLEWGDFVSVDEEGNPTYANPDVGRPVLSQPGSPEGFHIYGGTSLGSMIRQTDKALPYVNRTIFVLTNIKTEGHAPVAPSDAKISYGAPTPYLAEISASNGGYPAGARRIAFSFVAANGRHTMVSPKTVHTVAASGDSIRLTLYGSYPVGVVGLGIYMSKPGQTVTYLQEVFDLSADRPATHDMLGPYAFLGYEPGWNQTYLGYTSSPSAVLAPSNSDTDAGVYELYCSWVTPSGEALASFYPTYAKVRTAEAGIRTTIQVQPKIRPAGVIGWYCYLKMLDGHIYRVYPATSTPEHPLLITQQAEVYSQDPGRFPANWAVAQRDMPTTDNSGIPNPDIAPYDITSIPTPTLVSGTTYFVQLALTEGDREGARGGANSITISTTNRAIWGKVPKPVQQLPNPEGTEQDSAGIPLAYTIRQTPTVAGTYSQPQPGEHQLEVTSATSAETVSVAVGPTDPLDKTVHHTFVAEMEAYNVWAGNCEIALLEYTTATPTYPTTTPSRTTVIETMTDVGAVDVINGVRDVIYNIPTSFWLGGTLSYHIVFRFSGASKRLGMRVRHLAIFDQQAIPRKWVDPFTGVAQASDPNAPPAVPFPAGVVARIGPPKRTPVPVIGSVWNPIDRPLTTGTLQEYLDFEGGLPAGWDQTRTPTSGTTLTTNATAAISGTAGLYIEDTNTSAVSSIGISKTFTTEARHRLGVSAEIRSPAPTVSGARDYIYLVDADGIAFAIVSQDQSRNLIIWYRHAGVWFSRIIYRAVANSTVMDVDLQVSGAGTNRAIVSLWAALGTGQTKTLRARFEDIDLATHQAQRAFVGAVEYVASDTHQTHIDNVRVWDGGHKWYRDHNARGEFLNQAHLFMPKGSDPTQNAFLKDARIAVKPGKRYALATFFNYLGVVGTSHPLAITLHKQNGDTISLGSLINEAGITGTGAWAEYIREINTPYSATDPGQNCYEIRLNSRDIYGGAYVAQEVNLTELALGAPLVVDRSGGREENGVYRVTLDTLTPYASEIVGNLPKDWLTVGFDLEDQPDDTSVSMRVRSGPTETGPWSAYATSLAGVLPDNFLEVELTFVGDGMATPVLTKVAPYLDFAFLDSMLLKEDGSELPGGAIVTEYQIHYPDPQDELRRNFAGHYLSQPLADDVPWLDYFTIQFFTREGLTYFRNRWSKELFRIESLNEIVKIKLLEWPEVIVQPHTAKRLGNGAYYQVYATCEAGMSEVKEVTPLPEKDA